MLKDKNSCFSSSGEPPPGFLIFHLFQCFITPLSWVSSFFTFHGCCHFSPFSGVSIFQLFRVFLCCCTESATDLRLFLSYTSSRHLTQPAFIKASLEAGSSSLKVAGPPTEVRNTDPANVFI